MPETPDATNHTASEEELVRSALPLVHYAVADLINRIPRHVGRDDLMSAGLFGLAQAARSWDAGRGVTFERYARVRIRGALLDELRGRDWASRSVRSKARSLQSTTDGLTADLGRRPTATEVGERMGVSADEVIRLNDDIHRATVLHYDSVFLEADETGALATDDEGPTETMLKRETWGYLRDAVVALPERLRYVVVGYFFEERPMQELADELGVTESRISQMRAEALVLLKEGMNSQLDPEALPEPARANGRVAKRKAAYYAAVAQGSDYRTRIAADAPSVQERVASTQPASA
jgi:RNA polymerase sigma factor FliA